MRLVAAALAVVLAACAARVVPRDARPFRFARDTFAFPNETIWEYHAEGRPRWTKRSPPPDFALRCGPMARAARQFWAGARFDPARPRLSDAATAALVRAVLRTDPRDPPRERIVIPGYADLRTLTAAHAALVRDEIGSTWQAQLQRGNWRMIFPFTAGQQRDVARRLVDDLARGWPPVVHVVRFPHITLNHMLLVYAVERTRGALRFLAYDPNDAAAPLVLAYDRATRRFAYPETPYCPGGPVRVYEIYDGWLY